MKLTIEREFAVDPEVLWPWLTDPERMNEWSLAPAHPLTSGTAQRQGTVGSQRGVRVGVGPLRMLLIEEIRVAVHPTRFEYQVVSGGGLRHHYGTLTIAARPAGCHLKWCVEFQTWVPGVGYPMKWLVSHQLGASLSRLQQILEGPDGEPDRSTR